MFNNNPTQRRVSCITRGTLFPSMLAENLSCLHRENDLFYLRVTRFGIKCENIAFQKWFCNANRETAKLNTKSVWRYRRHRMMLRKYTKFIRKQQKIQSISYSGIRLNIENVFIKTRLVWLYIIWRVSWAIWDLRFNKSYFVYLKTHFTV